jgi:hypothetical protein
MSGRSCLSNEDWSTGRPTFLEYFPFDAQAHGKPGPEREAKCHQSETCRQQFERDNDPDRRQSINDERYRCDDETEFDQSHFRVLPSALLNRVLFVLLLDNEDEEKDDRDKRE